MFQTQNAFTICSGYIASDSQLLYANLDKVLNLRDKVFLTLSSKSALIRQPTNKIKLVSFMANWPVMMLHSFLVIIMHFVEIASIKISFK